MSYVEHALYGYLRQRLTGGWRVLISSDFAFFTLVIISLAVSSTVISSINRFYPIPGVLSVFEVLQISFSCSLLITSLLAFKFRRTNQRVRVFGWVGLAFYLFIVLFPEVLGFFGWFFLACFYSWVVLINFVVLLSIREFMVGWPGWVVSLGNPKGRVLFSPLIKIIGLAGSAFFIINLFNSFFISLLGLVVSCLILYVAFFFRKNEKNDIFVSIVSFFFVYALYHFGFGFVQSENLTGFVVFDIIVLVAVLLFSVQDVSVMFKKKGQDVPILVLLGLGLAYHTIIISTPVSSLVLLVGFYHQLSFVFCGFIIFAVLLLHVFYKPFIVFSTRQTGLKGLMSGFASIGLDFALKSFNALVDKLRHDWSFTIEKEKKGKG